MRPELRHAQAELLRRSGAGRDETLAVVGDDQRERSREELLDEVQRLGVEVAADVREQAIEREVHDGRRLLRRAALELVDALGGLGVVGIAGDSVERVGREDRDLAVLDRRLKICAGVCGDRRHRGVLPLTTRSIPVEVLVAFGLDEAGFLQDLLGLDRLAVADLEREHSAGLQLRRRGGREPAHEVEPVLAPVERESRLELETSGSSPSISPATHVREVGGDRVEDAVD